MGRGLEVAQLKLISINLKMTPVYLVKNYNYAYGTAQPMETPHVGASSPEILCIQCSAFLF